MHPAIGNRWWNTSQHEIAISLRVALGHQKSFNTRCVSAGGHQGANWLSRGMLEQWQGASRSTKETEGINCVYLRWFSYHIFCARLQKKHVEKQEWKKKHGCKVSDYRSVQAKGCIKEEWDTLQNRERGVCDSCSIISALGSRLRTLCFQFPAPTGSHTHLLQLLHRRTSVLGPAFATAALHQESKHPPWLFVLKRVIGGKRSEVISHLSRLFF